MTGCLENHALQDSGYYLRHLCRGHNQLQVWPGRVKVLIISNYQPIISWEWLHCSDSSTWMSKQIRNITNYSASCQSLALNTSYLASVLRSLVIIDQNLLSDCWSVKFFIQWLILIPGFGQAEGLSFSSVNDTFLINSAIKIFIASDKISEQVLVSL